MQHASGAVILYMFVQTLALKSRLHCVRMNGVFHLQYIFACQVKQSSEATKLQRVYKFPWFLV